MSDRPFILCIGGFDPSAGAGVLADIKTCEQNNAYGLAVNTATTFQNDHSFSGLNWTTQEDLFNQLQLLISEYPIAVVKIGLIENLQVLKWLIYEFRKHLTDSPIIWDPIISASAGFTFHSELDKNDLIAVLQNIDLVTPNIPEFDTIKSELDIARPGEFAKKYCSLLLKGGHSETDANDVLWTSEMEYDLIADRVDGGKHGTGCVLSSAIASYLAQGHDLPTACAMGKNYTLQFIESNNTNLGYHS